MDPDLKLPRAKREPSADVRTAARTMAEMFVALTDEGFTNAEAIQIIGLMLAGGPT